MAVHKSAKKRIRRTVRRTAINGQRVSDTRTFIKKVMDAIQSGNTEAAKAALQAVQPKIHRCVSKGILHKNTAARKLSRLSARIKSMKAA